MHTIPNLPLGSFVLPKVDGLPEFVDRAAVASTLLLVIGVRQDPQQHKSHDCPQPPRHGLKAGSWRHGGPERGQRWRSRSIRQRRRLPWLALARIIVEKTQRVVAHAGHNTGSGIDPQRKSRSVEDLSGVATARLSMGFSKKLANLEAAVSMFAAFYNFVWRTRHADGSGMSGRTRPPAAMMAGVTDRLWSFEGLYRTLTE
jgi:hypothetical protein